MAKGTANNYLAYIVDDDTDKIEDNELVFNMIAQILMSIIIFNLTMAMYHNDTHFGNFLYHKIKKTDGNFPFKILNYTINIKNIGYLWVINDFGLAKNLYEDKTMIKNIISDYKEVINELQHYKKYFKDDKITNFINDINDYLDPNLYSEITYMPLIISILMCLAKHTKTIEIIDNNL